MARRWDGEWLVRINKNGRVMLPLVAQGLAVGLQPTHYLIKQVYGEPGALKLVPMREATEEDLRPDPESEPEPPQSVDNPPGRTTRTYTPMEQASLAYACPYCAVSPGQGCIARPSGRKLTNYPEAIRWVHSRRLELVPTVQIEPNQKDDQ